METYWASLSDDRNAPDILLFCFVFFKSFSMAHFALYLQCGYWQSLLPSQMQCVVRTDYCIKCILTPQSLAIFQKICILQMLQQRDTWPK